MQLRSPFGTLAFEYSRYHYYLFLGKLTKFKFVYLKIFGYNLKLSHLRHDYFVIVDLQIMSRFKLTGINVPHGLRFHMPSYIRSQVRVTKLKVVYIYMKVTVADVFLVLHD